MEGRAGDDGIEVGLNSRRNPRRSPNRRLNLPVADFPRGTASSGAGDGKGSGFRGGASACSFELTEQFDAEPCGRIHFTADLAKLLLAA